MPFEVGRFLVALGIGIGLYFFTMSSLEYGAEAASRQIADILASIKEDGIAILLVEQDVKLAARCAGLGAPVAAVLEGGYNLATLPALVEAALAGFTGPR